MNILVVGLGNPILGDDGVGWKVVEAVQIQLTSGSTSPLKEGESLVDFICLSVGGISLMEHLIGFDEVILIDAFESDAPPGSISVLKLSELPNYSAYHITSVHDTSLQKAMELGREMGAHLPEDVTVVGIVTEHIQDFSEQLSPDVERVIPCVTKIVVDLLKEKIILAHDLNAS